MNKKKVDSILKGITAAGIAIGGVSSIQGADMVMAAIDESAADSNSLVDEGSLSESEWTEYRESTTQSMSETTSASKSESVSVSESISTSESSSTSESTSESSSANKSAKQSDAVQASESFSENDGYVTTEEPAGDDISVASFVSDVTYASVGDSSVGNAAYKSLNDVINDNVKNSSKTVYELGENKVLVRNNDGSGVVYYKINDGTIKQLDIDAKAIIDNKNGTVTVKFDGYYINSDGTWKNTTYTDYNEISGNKVFINGHFVVDKGGKWHEVLVDGKNVEYVGSVNKGIGIFKTQYIQIRIGSELYYLDGAHEKDGKFYAIPWNESKNNRHPDRQAENCGSIGNIRYGES